MLVVGWNKVIAMGRSSDVDTGRQPASLKNFTIFEDWKRCVKLFFLNEFPMFTSQLVSEVPSIVSIYPKCLYKRDH